MNQALVKQASAYYNELLEQSHLDSTIAGLNTAIQQKSLTVAGRSICNVLRPQFVDSASYEMIVRASTLVMRGFSELAQQLLADSSLRARLQLTPEEEELVLIDTGYGAPDVSARLDGFLDDAGGFRFVEYNADSPGGIGFGDVLADIFSSLPILQEFSRRYRYRAIPVRARAMEALLNAYHRWGGHDFPSIAIVDWATTPTRNEFVLMQEYFESRGCRVRIADPEELEYSRGKLYAAGWPIDLVYKRLVTFELLEKLGLHHPLVRAVRERAVCMANGFAVQMLFKKSLFAMLNDSDLFRPRDQEVIDAIHKHVPWSRLLRECKTDFHGQTVDLLPFLASNKERFVLKPSSEYGGKGVVLGWESTDTEWNQTLKAGLEISYITQERVNLGSESYPVYMDGKLSFEDRYFDLDPYVWNGTQIEGCGVRLSRGAILNVSAGGGSATPLFILSI